MSQSTGSSGFSASQNTARTLVEFGLIIALLLGVLVVGRSVVGCVAERAALALPTSLDGQLGDAAAKAILASHAGTSASAADSARVERVFSELVAKLSEEERASLGTPVVTLLEDETPNAFALPGGHVFVQTGLLARVGAGPEGDSQLRGVLGHELGHAVRRHALRLLARRLAFGLTIGLLMGNGDRLGDALLAGASQLQGLQNSREMETEADDFGVLLLQRSGFDIGGLATFLEGLEGQPVPELLSTHPDPSARAKRIRESAGR